MPIHNTCLNQIHKMCLPLKCLMHRLANSENPVSIPDTRIRWGVKNVKKISDAVDESCSHSSSEINFVRSKTTFSHTWPCRWGRLVTLLAIWTKYFWTSWVHLTCHLFKCDNLLRNILTLTFQGLWRSMRKSCSSQFQQMSLTHIGFLAPGLYSDYKKLLNKDVCSISMHWKT